MLQITQRIYKNNNINIIIKLAYALSTLILIYYFQKRYKISVQKNKKLNVEYENLQKINASERVFTDDVELFGKDQLKKLVV